MGDSVNLVVVDWQVSCWLLFAGLWVVLSWATTTRVLRMLAVRDGASPCPDGRTPANVSGVRQSERPALKERRMSTIPARSLPRLATPDLIDQYRAAVSSYAGRCTDHSPRQKRIDRIVDLIADRADVGDAAAVDFFTA